MPSDGDPLRRAGVVRDLRDGHALIGVEGGGCSSCGKLGACAIGKMASGRGETQILLPAPAALRIGDRVTLAIDGDRLVSAALSGYLLPAGLLLLGAGCGDAVAGNAGAVVGALAGLVAGFVAAGLQRRRGGPASDLRITRP